MEQPTPSGSVIFGASASILARMRSSFSLSGERISTVKTTLPGRTLRELGEKTTWPTPPTAPGWFTMATLWTISMMRAMARPALTRMFIGVEPVWASRPVSVNSSHQRP
ncbi:hypothetical protein D9M72_614950 [compost metagenome]